MFPDGFPLSPVDAIKFSANFGLLTPQEEQDWYKWLETATAEQQKELVDTLHQLYSGYQSQSNPPQHSQAQTNQPQNNPNQAGYNNFSGDFSQNNFEPNGQVSSNSENFGNQYNNQPNSFNSQNQSGGQGSQNNFSQIPVNSNQNFSNPQPSPQNFDYQNQPTAQNFTNNQFDRNSQDNFAPVNVSRNDNFQNNGFAASQNQERDNNYKPANQNLRDNQGSQNYPPANQNHYSDSAPQSQPVQEVNNQNPYADNSNLKKTDLANQFEPKEPKFENPSEESFLNLANSKYTRNPILEDHSPDPAEFAFDDEEENKKSQLKPEPIETSKEDIPASDFNDFAKEHASDDFIFEEPKPEEEKVDQAVKNKKVKSPSKKPEEAKVTEVVNPQEDFSFSESEKDDKTDSVKKPLYSAPEKNELEELYKLYINSQKKNLEDEQEFQNRQVILQDDAYQKQVSFWDKVMQVISNYEQMADNVLLMNEQIIRQAKEIQVLKNSTQARSGASLQDQINSLRYDLERVIREFDDYRAENYRRQKDMSEQVAAATADTYKTDGMLQKLDLLANRLTRLETQR